MLPIDVVKDYYYERGLQQNLPCVGC